ncbi:quinone oxidoreductase family protein [Streptomyces caatingaensis]|uniref:Quinone oxidoreductase n=1 Tax=Streptomyces caatingaensis TaxID=1678637 RepID=A0A0K9XGX1_9ACTN|nr:zinc-binding dehydrogenase [Streptomyces caatingaensis]KNB52306.1 quinone oxidoreductase [Streptomyces caatingaensis]
MRAIEFENYGGPEVLRVVTAEPPEPGPGQVSIDVAYAGVNFADVKARTEGYRVPALPFRPGLEASGRVRTLGEGVTGLYPGQPVAAFTPGGSYAEVVVADAASVFALPEGYLRVAATLPTVLPTAHALLHEVGRLRPGDTVLVQGAAGGVGTVVSQLAKAAGAGAVHGVVSTEAKAEYARRYGYDEVFTGPSFAGAVRDATGGRGVDLALDPVGGDSFTQCLASLATYGRLVAYGNASASTPWQVSQRDLFPATASVSGFSLFTLARNAPDALRELTRRAFRAVAEGTVKLPVTAEFPLAGAPEAHRLLGSRASTGKLLLRVGG